MSRGHPPADEDALACVRRLLREAAPSAAADALPETATPRTGTPEAGMPDLAGSRLVLTRAQRVDEAPPEAPLLLLSEALRAAPPEAPQDQPLAPAGPLDEAAVRRIVEEAVREALGTAAIRDLVRREVLRMLDSREG